MDIMSALKKIVESIRDYVQRIFPVIDIIDLPSEKWIGAESPYYQDVELSKVTASSMVNIQPDAEQLTSWQNNGLMLTTRSFNGGIRVYVTGGKPTEDYTVQVTIQEVAEAQAIGVYGNAVGGSGMPKTFVIVDSNNNEFTGIVVGQETIFTATASDITAGKVAGTSEGVVEGTHMCD